jgi:hypothetical protein
MSEADWLSSELDRAKREVQSWEKWKREAMRREANAISSVRELGEEGTNRDSAVAPLHPDN